MQYFCLENRMADSDTGISRSDPALRPIRRTATPKEKTMRKLLAVAVVLGACAGTNAAELQPMHGGIVDLGSVQGVAYYTVDGGRYDLVATLSTEDGTPVRFRTRLEDGQSVTLSSPLMVGDAPASVDIRRSGDKISVLPASAATN
jgi:hypothetical protein